MLCACGHDPSSVKVVDMGLQGASVGTATVQRGDSISMIAERYKVQLDALIAANNLSAPYMVHPSQRLILPPPKTYKVQSGDTVYEVSRLFSTTQTRLVRLNNIPKPYRLKIGQVLKLPMPEQMITASASAKPESVKRLQKRAVAKAPQLSGSGKFGLHVQGDLISTYGPKSGGLHNDGINIAAARGTSVKAAQSGVVAYVGDGIEGYGNLVLVRHDKGYITAYAHLDSTSVKRGSVLNKGDVLGKVGSTGNVSEPQLHFEIRKGTKAINPAVLL
jgi:murein DD-endopeptidase MepM/ murein hydrolase activator NlpD